MRRLGISLYPENSTMEKDKEYITLAAKYGFSRIFTCLLSVEGNREKVVGEFKELIAHANTYNMQVIADVAPSVLHELNIKYDDLSFFHELGAYGIRLDEGFSGLQESIMTCNPYNLKIEINISNGTKYLDNIHSFRPNTSNLIGCYNFYPHRYTGLSYDHFMKANKQVKEYGIRTAAFVGSQAEGTFGPWPVSEGLCTLEQHRMLPIEVQAKHLFATGMIDDVIIANAYATEEELAALSKLNPELMTFNMEFSADATELEKKIVLDEFHFNRGDVSEYMIRSTQSRVKYKNEAFPAHTTRDIKRGDIIIDNDLYGRYKGELQVALKDMPNSGRTNVVGRIVEEEIFLLDYVQAWDKLAFSAKK
jgi:uncharacterized protein